MKITSEVPWKGDCILWQRARDLAESRGFEMIDTCPIDDVCTGAGCVYLAPIEETVRRLDRLAELREELKNYVPTDSFQYEL